MPLIEDIRNDILDYRVPLSSILRKAKVLAFRLGNAELNEWLEDEQNGYKRDAASLPGYRRNSTQSWGTFVAPGFKSHQAVPIHLMPDSFRETLDTLNLLNGVADLESLQDIEPSELKMPWPSALVEGFNQMSGINGHMVGAYRVMPKQAIVQVLEAVRNRLLNFVLEIESIDPRAGEVPSVGRIDPFVVHQLFDRCIMNSSQGTGNFIQGNQGSNIATDNARISSSKASYTSTADAATALRSLEQHISDVAEEQRAEVRESIELLITAIEDNTVPKSRIVAATEMIANASNSLKQFLSDFAMNVAGNLAATPVYEGIRFALGIKQGG